MECQEGTQIDGYEILKTLGRGGQSVVYLALDTLLRRKVAVKFISDTYLADENGRRRFLLEAQALSSLSHPNIATIYHIGEYRDHPFIVMEYVDGMTLQDYQRVHQPNDTTSLNLITGVTEAIRYAHWKGFIHRDLKPSNIMVTKEGTPKLLDFGLARIICESERQRLDSPTELTASGVVMGTVYYLSPEQALSNSATEQSDLFSVGVIIYEMITGKRPFDRNSTLTTLYAIINAETPAIETHDRLSEQLKPIIYRLLQKDPANRYSSADALLSELRSLQDREKGNTTQMMSRTQRLVRPVRLKKWFGRIWLYLIILTLGILFWRISRMDNREREALSHERKAILVMPIKSGLDEQGRYLAGVVTSEIISSLSRSQSLRVLTVPREFADSDTRWSQQIINGNNVGLTLSGDLSLGEGRLRLSARIIDQHDFRVVWTKVFNEDISQLFSIPTVISAQLAFETGVIFKADQLEFPGQEAFDLYTQADMMLSSYDPALLSQSISLFRQCMKMAPDFRPVYEKLSMALMQYHNTGIDYHPKYLDEAYQTILEGRAKLGDSPLLSTLEIWTHLYCYDFPGAKILVDRMNREFVDPVGSKHLVWLLFFQGQTTQGLELLEDSIRREPFEASYHLNRVVLNTMMGNSAQVDLAVKEAREVFRSPMVEAIIDGWRAMAGQDFNLALKIFKRARQGTQYHLMDLACAEALFCQGDYAQAAESLEFWLGQNPYAVEGWWMLCLCYELQHKEAEHQKAATEAARYIDMLYNRLQAPFLKEAKRYFNVLNKSGISSAFDQDAPDFAGSDSMTRYLSYVIRLRLGMVDEDGKVPVPFNPTYWLNRFYKKEIGLIQNLTTD